MASTSTDIQTLETQILNVIQDDSYDVQNLMQLLMPITDYLNDPQFTSSLSEIVTIITTDRDGSGSFDIQDLTLLGSDFTAITSLVSAFALLLGSIPSINIQYSAGTTEQLVFKILAYIFLVVVPKQTGNPLSLTEKQSIVTIAVNIYGLIESSQLAQDLFTKILAYFKSKGMCLCCTSTSSQAQAQAVVASKMPQCKALLVHSMNNIRDKRVMQTKIRSLERKVNKKKQN
jgi:hypothetical protein